MVSDVVGECRASCSSSSARGVSSCASGEACRGVGGDWIGDSEHEGSCEPPCSAGIGIGSCHSVAACHGAGGDWEDGGCVAPCSSAAPSRCDSLSACSDAGGEWRVGGEGGGGGANEGSSPPAVCVTTCPEGAGGEESGQCGLIGLVECGSAGVCVEACTSSAAWRCGSEMACADVGGEWRRDVTGGGHCKPPCSAEAGLEHCESAGACADAV